MKLYNTLSREKEEFPEPDKQKKINFFVCGPTVYDDPHIGHARTYIFFDFFAKYLRARGYDVFYLQNITDIDDKIIKRSAERAEDPATLAEQYTKSYLEDMQALGVDAINQYAPATEFIPEIEQQVQRLIDNGFAYIIEHDGWYFDISKDKDYGKLSGRTVEQAEDGVSRIDEAIFKKNKGDFCLWKFWSGSDAEPKWESPLGTGRPGWHIEDTAITEKFFGPHYDIHGGGVDLKFPHHEAEMAQQISATGITPEDFVRVWMHTGALLVDGKKMSKSLGNFLTIKDFLKENTADTLRWVMLTHHYRTPLDYSAESISQAASAMRAIKIFLAKSIFLSKDAFDVDDDTIEKIFNDLDYNFYSALEDDINTPLAISSLFSAMSALQVSAGKLGLKASEKIYTSFKEKLELLGFALEMPEIPQEVQQKAQERELSRAHKQFKQSDLLRNEINALGYEVEDTSIGPFLWPK
jgi:cysteinyl-tRNA synthetase